jgi:pectate lyase C
MSKNKEIRMFSRKIFSKIIVALVVSASVSTSFAQVSDGRYVIRNELSGKVLDVEARSHDDGANVLQWDYLGNANQQWDVTNLGNGYYAIRAVHSGKSIDVYEWNANNGAEARQWRWLNGDNQHWAIDGLGDGTYSITSRFAGTSLEVYDFSTENGGDVRLWTYWGGDSQRWRFERVTASGNATGSSCVSTGSVSVSSTIYVTSGTYDGRCQTFNPTSALGDGSQSEGQAPVFRVENGATLKNVIIGNNGADGIHVHNGGTLDNIRWTNVGEDAMTIKSPGRVVMRNVEGYSGSDKFIQVNAESELFVENCIVDGMGKFLRQNGGSTFPLNVTVTNCQISNMNEGIFRSDSPNSRAFIFNSRVRNAGRVCIGTWASCGSAGLMNY